MSSHEGFHEDLERSRQNLGRPIEVINSLNLLAAARANLIDAIVHYDQAQFRLWVALGTPPPLVETSSPDEPAVPEYLSREIAGTIAGSGGVGRRRGGRISRCRVLLPVRELAVSFIRIDALVGQGLIGLQPVILALGAFKAWLRTRSALDAASIRNSMDDHPIAMLPDRRESLIPGGGQPQSILHQPSRPDGDLVLQHAGHFLGIVDLERIEVAVHDLGGRCDAGFKEPSDRPVQRAGGGLRLRLIRLARFFRSLGQREDSG